MIQAEAVAGNKINNEEQLTRKPGFWDYTVLSKDHLLKNIPSYYGDPDSFKAQMLAALKDLMDNACDAAEKNGNAVIIECSETASMLTNTGKITDTDIKKILNFLAKAGSKQNKMSFTRGMYGQGMMIAIMLLLRGNQPFLLRSGGKEYKITLLNRNSIEPQGVIAMTVRDSEKDENTVSVSYGYDRLDSNDYNEIIRHIKSYIAVNPNIEFVLNGHRYKKTTGKIVKSTKLDIYAYGVSAFEDFMAHRENNGRKGISEDFVRLFNVHEASVTPVASQIASRAEEWQFIYMLLRKTAHEIEKHVWGRDKIQKRFEHLELGEIIKSKAVALENGFAEIGIFKGAAEDSLVAINGSFYSHTALRLRASKTSRKSFLEISDLLLRTENKKENNLACFVLYNTCSPDYEGANKDRIIIWHPKVAKSLQKMIANCSKERGKTKELPATDKWIKRDLQDDVKKIYTDKEIDEHRRSANNKEVRGKGWKITNRILYLVLMAKFIAKSLIDKFGRITLRQLFYKLVTNDIIENTQKAYDNLGDHMTSARKHGLIAEDWFEDRSRQVHTVNAFEIDSQSPRDYIADRINSALDLPKFHRWEGQKYYVELWIEKDAMSNIFLNMTKEQQVTLAPVRGYYSETKKAEAKKRYREEINKGKMAVLLYFGDLDASGVNIFDTLHAELRADFKEEVMTIERIGLTPEQVKKYDLIPCRIKDEDSRSKSFREEYIEIQGLEGAYEMDALDPEVALSIAKDAISQYYDPSLYDQGKQEKWRELFEKERNAIIMKLSATAP